MKWSHPIASRKSIAVVGGILILLIVSMYHFVPRHHVPPLPRTILQLRLVEETGGEKAREVVNKMHQQSVTPEENIIGTYFSADGCATLYVSAYQSEETAKEQFALMAGLISKNEGVFTHFRELFIDGTKVYLCVGLGQVHYFFLHQQNLYWLAIDMPIARSSVQELIQVLHRSK